jgi:Zn-dependent metalloprotease
MSLLIRCGTLSACLACLGATAFAQGGPRTLSVTREGQSDLRAVDLQIDQMIRSRDLRVRDTPQDGLLPGRRHERLDQYHRGVRIVGGDLTRQTAPDGTVSVFGVLHPTVGLNTDAALSRDAARSAIGRAVDGQATGDLPELVVLPLSDGYHLAYRGQAIKGIELVNVFVDANTGALLQEFSEFQTEGIVGKGTGTFGDDKKISVKAASGTFVADDGLRPAAITTYDMKGNLTRTIQILNRLTNVTAADIAADSDNVWTDPGVVDAHVYAGWYYDFLFKRFGRHGLDDRDLRIAILTHPVRLADLPTASPEVVGTYYDNAFFCSSCGPDGRGAITFGEGAPRGYFGNFEVKNFAASLDVVAHELTHGVTANSARLNGFTYSEAGALNEAFSDMIGLATTFSYEPPGNATLQANYTVGKDLFVPMGTRGIRSISNPGLFGDPNHYTQRIVGFDPHYNSTIASHAFYLAIEGGTNRTSGQTVQGVGAANRDQIEKAFFRALTVLMPSSATFALTRAATIQAARDLYGTGSAAERAITQAWDAVGVQPRTAATVALMPDPAAGSQALCGGVRPSWLMALTLSAGDANLRVTDWHGDYYDAAGRQLTSDDGDGANFATFFGACGPRSDRILAQTDTCASLCVNLEGATSGSTQFTFHAVDEAGRAITLTTPRATLLTPR